MRCENIIREIDAEANLREIFKDEGTSKNTIMVFSLFGWFSNKTIILKRKDVKIYRETNGKFKVVLKGRKYPLSAIENVEAKKPIKGVCQYRIHPKPWLLKSHALKRKKRIEDTVFSENLDDYSGDTEEMNRRILCTEAETTVRADPDMASYEDPTIMFCHNILTTHMTKLKRPMVQVGQNADRSLSQFDDTGERFAETVDIPRHLFEKPVIA